MCGDRVIYVSAILGTLAALTSARADQLTFELGKATKHGQHQPAVRRRGIGPSIAQAFEAGTAVRDFLQHVEQIAC